MSFAYPENVNEPTHSTQFSFDDSIVCPNFITSPSLTNHASNSKTNVLDDVIESTEFMQEGCFMIILKLEVDDKGEMNEKASTKLQTEWNVAALSHDYQFINSPAHKICVADIDKVTKLHQASAARVQAALNIPGVEQIGLQSVTLRLSMKNDSTSNYFLIFDEYRHAFIWNTGLRTLVHLLAIKQPVTTIAFCCSATDRINNLEMHDKMKVNYQDETFQWIQHIASKLPQVQQHIARCHSFAEAACILDSSEHLSLLLVTKALAEMYNDAKRLSSLHLYQLTKEEITSLREVWLSLLADLTVAVLKEHQLRTDMKASVSSATDINAANAAMSISK